MARKKNPKAVPRFVVSLVDTKTDVSLSAGASDMAEFYKPLPKKRQTPGVHNELDLMFVFFAEDVAKREQESRGAEE
jgi:hypothetical protein